MSMMVGTDVATDVVNEERGLEKRVMKQSKRWESSRDLVVLRCQALKTGA